MEEIISDADITEIMINGPDNIFYEKQGIICKYDDFKPVGTKMFPHMLTLNGKTQATQKPRDVKVGIKLKGVKMDKDWETRTTLSGKYKAVSVEEVLEKITSL